MSAMILAVFVQLASSIIYPAEPPECIEITSLEQSMGTDFNGYWDEAGDYNNNIYYTFNRNYLFVSIKYNLWIISSELSDTGIIYAFCGESNVISCSSQWYYADSVSNAWTIDSDVVIFDCTNIEPIEPTEPPEPTEGIEPPECIQIKSLQPSLNIDFKFYAFWNEAGIYNNKPFYTADGYYLFVSITYGLWVISSELSDTGTVAYCSEANIELCSLKWYYYDSISNTLVADTDAIVIDCTNMEAPEPTEPIELEPPECVGIQSLQHSMGTDVNGYWDEAGTYKNNIYYTLNGKYLSFQYDLYWIIAISTHLSDLTTTDIYAYCSEANVMLCSSKWYYHDSVSNSWSVDFDSVTFDCDNMPNSQTHQSPGTIEGNTKPQTTISNEGEMNSDSDD